MIETINISIFFIISGSNILDFEKNIINVKNIVYSKIEKRSRIDNRREDLNCEKEKA